MASTITINGSVAIKLDGTGQTAGIAPSAQTLTLAEPAEMTSGQTTMSTSYAQLSFGEVAFTEWSWGSFINHSATDGETIVLAKQVAPGTNLVADSVPTIGGASVPATPATGAAGRYRTITSDGTSQGVNWKDGDIAIYLGTSGLWGRIPIVEILSLAFGDAAGPLPFKPDGVPWFAKALAGTPRLGYAIAGALA